MNTALTNPFDAVVKEYDQWFDDNRYTFLSELEAIRFFLPKQGEGVEIGAGTGRFAMELRIKYGIEPSGNMAALAKQRGIEVIVGNAENMPYKDGSFEFAIMVAVDPFVQDILQVYCEIHRILRKDGKLIVGTLHKEGDVAKKYMSITDSEVYKNACFHTVSETTRQLKSAGFSIKNTCQTLLTIHPHKVEKPIPGHDRGSFVAIEAIKKTDNE
jgi:ubiquinone/menaquinone biosynthesis C-methylase UbiE